MKHEGTDLKTVTWPLRWDRHGKKTLHAVEAFGTKREQADKPTQKFDSIYKIYKIYKMAAKAGKSGRTAR